MLMEMVDDLSIGVLGPVFHMCKSRVSISDFRKRGGGGGLG